jgi:hypothetical protein
LIFASEDIKTLLGLGTGRSSPSACLENFGETSGLELSILSTAASLSGMRKVEVVHKTRSSIFSMPPRALNLLTFDGKSLLFDEQFKTKLCAYNVSMSVVTTNV